MESRKPGGKLTCLGPGGAGRGRAEESLTGFPAFPSSLLPCSGEVLGLVKGEGQLVVITHHLCRQQAWL